MDHFPEMFTSSIIVSQENNWRTPNYITVHSQHVWLCIFQLKLKLLVGIICLDYSKLICYGRSVTMQWLNIRLVLIYLAGYICLSYWIANCHFNSSPGGILPKHGSILLFCLLRTNIGILLKLCS